LVEKPEGKRLLTRPKCKLGGNIRILEIKWQGVHWMDVAQNRDEGEAFVDMVMSLRVPLNVC
jgi:hypothetical protein